VCPSQPVKSAPVPSVHRREIGPVFSTTSASPLAVGKEYVFYFDNDTKLYFRNRLVLISMQNPRGCTPRRQKTQLIENKRGELPGLLRLVSSAAFSAVLGAPRFALLRPLMNGIHAAHLKIKRPALRNRAGQEADAASRLQDFAVASSGSFSLAAGFSPSFLSFLRSLEPSSSRIASSAPSPMRKPAWTMRV